MTQPLYQISPLRQAIAERDVAASIQCLQKGASPTTDDFGTTTLHLAAMMGSIELATLSIGRGVEANCRTLKGKIAAHYALSPKTLKEKKSEEVALYILQVTRPEEYLTRDWMGRLPADMLLFTKSAFTPSKELLRSIGSKLLQSLPRSKGECLRLIEALPTIARDTIEIEGYLRSEELFSIEESERKHLFLLIQEILTENMREECRETYKVLCDALQEFPEGASEVERIVYDNFCSLLSGTEYLLSVKKSPYKNNFYMRFTNLREKMIAKGINREDSPTEKLYSLLQGWKELDERKIKEFLDTNKHAIANYGIRCDTTSVAVELIEECRVPDAFAIEVIEELPLPDLTSCKYGRLCNSVLGSALKYRSEAVIERAIAKAAPLLKKGSKSYIETVINGVAKRVKPTLSASLQERLYSAIGSPPDLLFDLVMGNPKALIDRRLDRMIELAWEDGIASEKVSRSWFPNFYKKLSKNNHLSGLQLKIAISTIEKYSCRKEWKELCKTLVHSPFAKEGVAKMLPEPLRLAAGGSPELTFVLAWRQHHFPKKSVLEQLLLAGVDTARPKIYEMEGASLSIDVVEEICDYPLPKNFGESVTAKREILSLLLAIGVLFPTRSEIEGSGGEELRSMEESLEGWLGSLFLHALYQKAKKKWGGIEKNVAVWMKESSRDAIMRWIEKTLSASAIKEEVSELLSETYSLKVFYDECGDSDLFSLILRTFYLPALLKNPLQEVEVRAMQIENGRFKYNFQNKIFPLCIKECPISHRETLTGLKNEKLEIALAALSLSLNSKKERLIEAFAESIERIERLAFAEELLSLLVIQSAFSLDSLFHIFQKKPPHFLPRQLLEKKIKELPAPKIYLRLLLGGSERGRRLPEEISPLPEKLAKMGAEANLYQLAQLIQEGDLDLLIDLSDEEFTLFFQQLFDNPEIAGEVTRNLFCFRSIKIGDRGVVDAHYEKMVRKGVEKLKRPKLLNGGVIAAQLEWAVKESIAKGVKRADECPYLKGNWEKAFELGRTKVLKNQEGFLAIKWLKRGEEVEALLRESALLCAFCELKERGILKSDYPKPLGVYSFASKVYDSFKPKGHGAAKIAFLYSTPNDDYFHYLHESTLSLESYSTGQKKHAIRPRQAGEGGIYHDAARRPLPQPRR